MEIKNKQFDEERALYASSDILVTNCRFEGPADGESALKESTNVRVDSSYFDLRYPFWHDTVLSINSSVLTANCRAALWYSKEITIRDSVLDGIKALRECENITILNSSANSKEFMWRCKDIHMEDSSVESEYPFFESSNITLKNFNLKGKYSFQYAKNVLIEDSNLDTKDAFWHTDNVTVKNTIIKGEYLGWYSNNLTLINCTIIGTQPLCYCTNLKLIDCKMIDCDFSFEYSTVSANIIGSIISVKNPISGEIIADKIEEIILDNHQKEGSNCKIITKE